jgi:hypothetical protein
MLETQPRIEWRSTCSSPLSTGPGRSSQPDGPRSWTPMPPHAPDVLPSRPPLPSPGVTGSTSSRSGASNPFLPAIRRRTGDHPGAAVLIPPHASGSAVTHQFAKEPPCLSHRRPPLAPASTLGRQRSPPSPRATVDVTCARIPSSSTTGSRCGSAEPPRLPPWLADASARLPACNRHAARPGRGDADSELGAAAARARRTASASVPRPGVPARLLSDGGAVSLAR